MSPLLTGSQTSMASAAVITATASKASRRVRAAVSGETTASVRTSTRFRAVRSHSWIASMPKRTPPTAPPAMAGFARYMESMVLAVAGL